MGPKLQALFAEHKTAILGVSAVGVAGLALLNRRKAPGGGSPAVGASPAGTIPAAAVVPGAGGGYDSSAYDVYSALQSQLQQMNRVNSAPAPTSSSLLSPGFYRKAGGTTIWQIDGQGQRNDLTLGEWQDFAKKGASWTPITQEALFDATKPVAGSR